MDLFDGNIELLLKNVNDIDILYFYEYLWYVKQYHPTNDIFGDSNVD